MLKLGVCVYISVVASGRICYLAKLFLLRIVSTDLEILHRLNNMEVIVMRLGAYM